MTLPAGATAPVVARLIASASACSRASYLAKLIAALRHPEPFTQRRAAYILGLLHDPSAVEALAAVLAGSADPYVKGEAAHSLGASGGGRACEIPQQVTQDETQPSMVRRTATAALDNQRPIPGENNAAGRRSRLAQWDQPEDAGL